MKKAFSLIELSIVILIIGILIAGVTQGSRLVSAMKLNTARSVTQSAEVNSITGVVTWLESTADKSFDDSEETDGSIITNWYDINPQSLVKNNAQQSSGTANLHPTYKANGINGLPAVNFNGSTNFIDTATDVGGLVTEFSIFVVAVMPTIPTGGTEMAFVANNLPWVGGNGAFNFKSYNGLIADQMTSGEANVGTVQNNVPFLAEVVDNGTTATTYRNKVAGGTTTTTTGVFKSLAAFNIGSWYNGTARTRYMGGNIGEVIIFNRGLKTEERTAVENYLIKKWGIR